MPSETPYKSNPCTAVTVTQDARSSTRATSYPQTPPTQPSVSAPDVYQSPPPPSSPPPVHPSSNSTRPTHHQYSTPTTPAQNSQTIPPTPPSSPPSCLPPLPWGYVQQVWRGEQPVQLPRGLIF